MLNFIELCLYLELKSSPISGDLRSFGDVVKRGQNSIKIGMHLNFGPRSPVEFEAFIQKK